MKKTLHLFFILLLMGFNAHATEYFWKGGSGDFNDPNKWWLFSYGSGITALQAPISIDNVHFLAAAFTAPGATVTVNTNANCNDMIWDNAITAANAPTVTSASINVVLDVYGSLSLATNMNFNYTGVLQFRSTDALETIETRNYNLRLYQLTFYGGNTTQWQLQSDLYIKGVHPYYHNVNIKSGHLNTMGKSVDIGSFTIENGFGIPSLTIAGSKVKINGDWAVHATNIATFNTAGSHIRMINDVSWFTEVNFKGGVRTYDTLTTVDICNINYDNTTFNHVFAKKRLAFYLAATPIIHNLYAIGGNEVVLREYTTGASGYNNITVTLENVFVESSCSDFVFLHAESYCVGTISKVTTGTLTLQKVILQNLLCNTTGGRSYVANNSKNAGKNAAAWTINEPVAQDMYFRDYAGDNKWHNPNNWEIWDGMAFQPNVSGCVPTPNDNVFFDGASFPNAVKNVQVDSASYCRNMTWLPTVAAGATALIYQDIFVFGDFTLNAPMGTIANNTGKLMFMGRAPNNLNPNGITVNAEMTVNPFAFYWVTSNLTARYLNAKLKSRLHAQNINMTLQYHALDTGYYNNVYVNLVGDGTLTYIFTGGYNMNYQGTTTFQFTQPVLTNYVRHFNFGVVMPNVIVDGNTQYVGYNSYIYIQGDYRHNNNTNVYYDRQNVQVNGLMPLYNGDVYVTAGKTYQFNSGIFTASGTLHSIGDCVNYVNWAADQLNVTFSGGANILYNFIKGWNNAGNPAITANNSINGSGNTNVNFVAGAGVTYYWRAHSSNPADFVGNWTDPGHWTTNESDVQGMNGCLPTLADTVVFDNMSFSGASNGCTINNFGYCKVLWTKAAIKIDGNKDLYIANSMILDPTTQYLHVAAPHPGSYINFVGSDTTGIIDTKSVPIGIHVKFANAAGRWTMKSTWLLRGALLMYGGKLVTEGNYFECWSYSGSAGTTFDFRNSTVYVPRSPLNYTPWYVAPGANIMADNSFLDFNVLSSYWLSLYMGAGKQYNRVRFNSPTNDFYLYNDASYRHAEFVRGTYFYSNNTFDSLTFHGGRIFYFQPGRTQTLASPHGKILVDNVGPGSFVNFETTISGQIAYFHKEYGSAFCVDWLKIKDNHATKGAVPADPYWATLHPYLQFETGVNCDNINGTATGIWAFSLPPILNVVQDHDPIFNICAGDTTIQIPIEMTGTYPYSIICTWTDQWGNSGADTILVDDDDHNVFTPFQYTLVQHPYTNTNYNIDIAALRCGKRMYGAPISVAQAVLPEGVLVAQNNRGSCYLNNNAVWAHFVDEVDGRPICSLLDSTGTSDNTALELTHAWADFDPTVQTWNGLPYLPRTWKIEPTNSDTARVRLYFTQTELDSLENHVYDGNINIATELILWKFVDTIKNGTPIQVPFTVIPLAGNAADPFTSTAGIYAIEFAVGSFSGFMLQPTELAVLPLDLLSFDAMATENRTVRLDWATANEYGVQHFEVERSADAINFEYVGKVNAQGNAENYYTFDDIQPYSGVSYYRLKLVNADGDFSYTYIRSVELKGFEIVNVFPVPVRGGSDLNVQLNNSVAVGNLSVEVIDVLGRSLYQTIQAVNGSSTMFSVPMSQLQAGNYYLRLIDANGDIRQKAFVVQ